MSRLQILRTRPFCKFWNRSNLFITQWTPSLSKSKDLTTNVKFFSTFHRLEQNSHRESSSLYVRHGDVSNASVVDVDLALNDRLENPEVLIENVRLREMENLINIQSLVEKYTFYTKSKEEETNLESEKLRIAGEMKGIIKKKQEEANKQMKDKLIAEGKAIREKLKSIQAQLWDLEAEVMLEGLQLPTDLAFSTGQHERVIDVHTPTNEQSYPSEGGQSEAGCIQFSDTSPGCCYLHGKYAKKELELSHMVSQKLRKAGLIQIACPDMVKTLAMEACGEDFMNAKSSLLLQPKAMDIEAFVERGGDASNMQKWDIMLYLCGGSSLSAISSSIAEPDNINSLLEVSQSSQISMFAATDDPGKIGELYEDYISTVWNLYKQLNIPIRKVQVGAVNLKPAEGCRIDIEAQLRGSKNYVKVGAIGYYDQYVSRRLIIKSSKNIKDVYNKNYLYMVYGTVLDTHKLMNCLFEQGS